MIGALLQLSAYGTENIYMNGNPQVNFFRSVYRQHSNFAMENIRIDYDGTNCLTDKNPTTFTFNIKRHADLLGPIFLVVSLPNIWSDDKYKFQWIKNLGSQIVERATLYFDSQKIQEIHGHSLHIYHRLKCNYSKNLTYNDMIGHSPKLYNPTNFNTNTYKNGKLGSTPPSINGDLLYIPLTFFFTSMSGLYLPLISLQSCEISIQIELKNVNDWFTIIDQNHLSKTYGKRVRPTNFDTIFKFIEKTNFKTAFEIYIDATYIYLDNDIRRKFALSTNEYLITQNQFYVARNLPSKYTADIKFLNLIKELYFYLQKSTVNTTNLWSNFSNIDMPYENYFQGDIDSYTYIDALSINDIRLQAINNWSNYKSDILQTALLRFNDDDRTLLLDNKYFRGVQVYQHHVGSNNYSFDEDVYIYNYNFGLEADIFQPTGACNFTALKKMQLMVNMLQPPINRIFTIIYANIITNNMDINIYFRNVYFTNSVNNVTDNVFTNNLQITSYTGGNLYGKVNNNNMYITGFDLAYSANKTILNNQFSLTGGSIKICDDFWNVISTSMIVDGVIEFTYVNVEIKYKYKVDYVLVNTTDSTQNYSVNNINSTDYNNIVQLFPNMVKYSDIDGLQVSSIIKSILENKPRNGLSITNINIHSIDIVNHKLYVLVTLDDDVKYYNGCITYTKLYTLNSVVPDVVLNIINLSEINTKFILYNASNMDFAREITFTSPSMIVFRIETLSSAMSNMWNYDLYVEGINYNSLQVVGGYGSIKYAT